MRRLALTLLLATLAGPVQALSCMAPDAVWLYQQIKNDDADYLLVKGTITLTEAPNLPAPAGMKTTEAFTKGRATGLALSASGFDVPFDRAITIRATCVASWCGSPKGLSQGTRIFAVQIEADRLILERGPCGGLVQLWSKEEEARLLECHLKGNCELREF